MKAIIKSIHFVSLFLVGISRILVFIVQKLKNVLLLVACIPALIGLLISVSLHFLLNIRNPKKAFEELSEMCKETVAENMK